MLNVFVNWACIWVKARVTHSSPNQWCSTTKPIMVVWISEYIKDFQNPRDAESSNSLLVYWLQSTLSIECFHEIFWQKKKTLGLEVICFYSAEVIGGLLWGKFLDSVPLSRRRGRAWLSLVLLSLVTTLSFVLAGWVEWPNRWDTKVEELSYDTSSIVLPTCAFTLWGFSDSMVQTYSYWLIGALYEEGDHRAHSVGFYKMIQSAGWSLGFFLTPTHRMPPLAQLFATSSCFVVGTVLALFQLPRAGDDLELDQKLWNQVLALSLTNCRTDERNKFPHHWSIRKWKQNEKSLFFLFCMLFSKR